MLFDDTYKTISQPAEGIFRDKGSKFLAYAYPISNEGQIKPIIAQLKSLHPSANHHCWAARLGSDQSGHRFNDDGEPAGSAGRPILNIILSKGLNNILVVVVRYFGGTLLGIPGLINAYKASTEAAIAAAEVVQKTFNDIYEVKFDYPQMNEVMKLVKDQNLLVLHQNFDLTCALNISIRKTQVDSLVQKFCKLSNVNLTWLYSN